ncbi:Nif-specific regulatory protein [uncultured Alphaproteobacteria bacterium]|uniref:Nif-specific regulatory protein n=1 Tax=uncultured Alphaproteobacteria bacterium TaxID=91750 RepID=A0A212K672_9PROT|nr:Nif-specific regulatory protein [uncultured Alphaproteobacteria bacterium]
MPMDRSPRGVAADRGALIETELEILFAVSEVLGRSLDPPQTFARVLDLLHDRGGYVHGFIVLKDEGGGDSAVRAAHRDVGALPGPVRYAAGEGIVGQVIARGETALLPRIADEPAFLHRPGIFDRDLPFIAAPIPGDGEETVGALAVQPPAERALLGERSRFVEIVANLISQSVRLDRRVREAQQEVRDERDTLRRRVRGQHGFDTIVGHTPVMRQVFEQVRLVSKWNTTVLIRGESGTGKELIANAIHYNSPRAAQPFVKLNCAALPENLLESEMFGHEKGAFTGAQAQRKGRFELADGGTLFLDEIGEISGLFQSKLLRVLQEGEFERVGGTETLKVDVRVIAATNRDLEDAVAGGGFREDLYYRLNVMPIRTPPLRERIEDIPDLARFMVDKIARVQRRTLSIDDDAIRLLLRHRWPGNVRELENSLERAAILSETGVIDERAVTLAGLRMAPPSGPDAPPRALARTPPADLDDPGLSERDRVVAALERAGWVQAKAARLLNMTPRQIAYRIQTLGIDVKQF